MALNTNTNTNNNATGSGTSTGNNKTAVLPTQEKILFDPASSSSSLAKKREERVWEGRIVEEGEVKGWFVQMRGKEKG